MSDCTCSLNMPCHGGMSSDFPELRVVRGNDFNLCVLVSCISKEGTRMYDMSAAIEVLGYAVGTGGSRLLLEHYVRSDGSLVLRVPDVLVAGVYGIEIVGKMQGGSGFRAFERATFAIVESSEEQRVCFDMVDGKRCLNLDMRFFLLGSMEKEISASEARVRESLDEVKAAFEEKYDALDEKVVGIDGLTAELELYTEPLRDRANYPLMTKEDKAKLDSIGHASESAFGLVKLGTKEKFEGVWSAMVGRAKVNDGLVVPRAFNNKYGAVKLNGDIHIGRDGYDYAHVGADEAGYNLAVSAATPNRMGVVRLGTIESTDDYAVPNCATLKMLRQELEDKMGKFYVVDHLVENPTDGYRTLLRESYGLREMELFVFGLDSNTNDNASDFDYLSRGKGDPLMISDRQVGVMGSIEKESMIKEDAYLWLVRMPQTINKELGIDIITDTPHIYSANPFIQRLSEVEQLVMAHLFGDKIVQITG